MDGILLIAFLLSIVAIFIGIIKPSIVIRWKENSNRKDVFKVYGAIIIVSSILLSIFGKRAENKETIQQEQNKSFSISSINLSNYNLTMNDKQSVSIQLIQDENNYVEMTIEKNIIEHGYNYDSRKHNNTKYPVDITAYLNEKRYNFYNKLNVLKMKILEYNKNTKQATISINTTLNNINNRDDIAELLNIKIKIEKDNFDLLTKDFGQENKGNRDYANKILNTISQDFEKHNNHLLEFSKLLNSNIVDAFDVAKRNNYYARKWETIKYISADTFGGNGDKDVEKLIESTRNLALKYQIYYDALIEFLDNQKTSNLSDVKKTLGWLENRKTDVMSQMVLISSKYNLEYNKKKNIWLRKN